MVKTKKKKPILIKKSAPYGRGEKGRSISLSDNSRRNNVQTKQPKTTITTAKKRKLPTSFLDSQSLEIVVGPQHQLIHTPVAPDVLKEVFLDRLVKEIIKPYFLSVEKKRKQQSLKRGQHVMRNGTLQRMQEKSNPNDDATKTDGNPYKQRIILGTNQCSRLLQSLAESENNSGRRVGLKPSLIVLAKDLYPPTLLVHIPYLAQQLGNIPLLLLPGKASIELGQVFAIHRTSVAVFLFSSKEDSNSAKETIDKQPPVLDPLDSFVSFIVEQLPKQDNNVII